MNYWFPKPSLPKTGTSYIFFWNNSVLENILFTDRYKPLPNAEQKLQFLDLQLELLEDFRVRLIQVKGTFQNPLGDCYCSILNTSHYVAEVLREWSELVVSRFLVFLEFVSGNQSVKILIIFLGDCRLPVKHLKNLLFSVCWI